jgi:hypothetical protein
VAELTGNAKRSLASWGRAAWTVFWPAIRELEREGGAKVLRAAALYSRDGPLGFGVKPPSSLDSNIPE